MDSPKFLIYGLVDPRTQELRYVGKSCSGMRRPAMHAQPGYVARHSSWHVVRWIRQLLRDGLMYEVEVLEECSSREELAEAERHFIAYFRFIGCRLTNLTDGGEGVGGWRHSVESRAKISEAMRLRYQMPGVRERQSLAQTGVKRSAQAREAISRGKRGLKLGPQSLALREKQVRVHGGRPVVDEQGRVYIGVCDAARSLGLSAAAVSQSLRRGCRAMGHVFRFVE